ncbi:NAD(P)-binding protein [Auriculariales sp. MPI-PUGE-AT-0066]|nr:NAD(P)-binding protein [Auriculariales sp. MPI-PUGE-AT-0066]
MASLPQTFKAIQIHEHGGPEVLRLNDVPVPKSGDNLIVKVEWAGINYIDNFMRSGMYPNKGDWPLTLGVEAAGTIVALPVTVPQNSDYDARRFTVGQKVAVCSAGGFAEYMSTPWQSVYPLAEGIDTRSAAAFTQALVAITNAKECYEPKKGDTILVHAAAGGLGTFYCQVFRALGCRVIGTVSTPEKAAVARDNGAEHVLLYAGSDKVDIEAEVQRLTDGKGVHAIFDSVGKDTWELDLKLVRKFGTIVLVGSASGPVPPISPMLLAAKNVKICRPSLFTSLSEPSEALAYVDTLWKMMNDDLIKVHIFKEYPFSVEGLRAATADQTGRSTIGKMLIKVAE